jgi:hypothetical protein
MSDSGLQTMTEAAEKYIPVLADLFPHFYYDSLFWFVFFLILLYSTKTFISTFFPNVVKNIQDEQTRVDYFNYYLSLSHHIVVVPLACYRLMTIDSPDLISSFMISGGANYEDHTKMFYHCESSAYMTGYLMADLVSYAIPMAMQGNFVFLGHHILALGVSALVPIVTAEVAVYCSRVMLLEMSSIFFALRFLLKNSGFDNSPLIFPLEIGFIVSFFLTRVVNLSVLVPQVYYDLVADAESTASEIKLGWFIIALFAPLLLLQVYWFITIVKTALGTLGGTDKEKEQ